MTDPIKAALEAAMRAPTASARTNKWRDDGMVHEVVVQGDSELGKMTVVGAFATARQAVAYCDRLNVAIRIAAFLRTFDEGERLSPHYLAAAVEAAARGDV